MTMVETEKNRDKMIIISVNKAYTSHINSQHKSSDNQLHLCRLVKCEKYALLTEIIIILSLFFFKK